MKKNILLILSLIITTMPVFSQDMDYTKSIVKELSSEKYFGRGYVNSGDSMAAEFLKKQFQDIGLEMFNQSYYQNFSISVNTIQNQPEFIFGNNKLEPTIDYVVIPYSKSIDEWIKICWINKATITNYWRFNAFYREDKSDCFLCIDKQDLDNEELFTFANLILSKNLFKAKGIIEASDRLKYTAKNYISDFVHLQIKPENIDNSVDSIYIKIQNDFIDDYKTQNIVGKLKGKSDSIIMITAHYDHLGMMGDRMFPGANDNASGVSMVLNLAKYYKDKELEDNLVFVLFSAEEAGLLGAEYFAENPYFDLSLVKTLINFDMVGTGEEGLYAFNGKEYPYIDTILHKINSDNKYFETFNTSHAVYSSDHAPFYKKGVNALFFYAAGNNDNYHQPQDKFEDVSFFAYSDIYKFIIDFIDKL